MRKIDKIIFHVTDSPDTLDVGVKEIREWHVKGRGWSDCGYHFIVRRNGVVEAGRPVTRAGAHCEGKNTTSIGIVWVGRDRMTVVQHEALLHKLSDLLDEYRLQVKDVYGHREFNAGKTCPNYSPEKLRAELQALRDAD